MTDSNPSPDPTPYEPTDVGPAFGGDAAATDADRSQVVALLRAAFAEGHLSAQECDSRIAEAQAAVTFDDLVPLTRDLMDVRAQMSQTPTPGVLANAPKIDPVNASTQTESFVAIFSGVTRSGHWRVRRNSSALAVFGGVDLDLSEAVLEDSTITINVFAIFGGVNLIVPPGCQVQDSVGAIFGGTDRNKLAPPVPGMPTIIVRGLAAFGGVGIRNPKKKK